MSIALATPAALPIACGDAPILVGSSSGHGAGAPSSSGSGAAGPSDAGPDIQEAGADVAAPDAKCDPVSYDPVPADACGVYVHLPCGLPAGVVPGAGGGCFLLLRDCKEICPGSFFDCHAAGSSCDNGVISGDMTGNIDIDCSICPGGTGRLPAGLARVAMRSGRSPIGDWFAAVAHLEAASVHAFRRLRRELTALGAPPRLLRAARSAQRDEGRHARLTARMARRFGGALRRPRVERMAPRPLAAVAIENAVEGCVRETFGALVASFQAANARDPEIAWMMGAIARDETRHAALSWAVGEWSWIRLDREARSLLVARCRQAIEGLRNDAGYAGHDLARPLGLPNAEQRRALVDVLEAHLWPALAA